MRSNQVVKQVRKITSFMANWKTKGINYAFSQTNVDPTEILPQILIPKPTNWRNFFRFQKLGILTACDIGQPLDKSTKLGHTTGIVINNAAEIGKNVHIRNNVTIGGKNRPGGVPTIEDGVVIGAGVAIIGGVTVGEGAIIGANATVVSDIPPYSVAVGNPAEVIEYIDPDE